MKKTFSILVSCAILLSLLVFSPMTSFSQNELDQMGFDPWVSLFHDSSNSANCVSSLVAPFKEGALMESDSSTGSFRSTPLIHNNIAYITYLPDGRTRVSEVVALDISTDDFEEMWRVEVEGTIFSTPTLDPSNNRIFVSASFGVGRKTDTTSTVIYCLDLDDGEEMWNSSYDGGSFTSLAYDKDSDYLFLSTVWMHEKKNMLGDTEFTYEDSEGLFYCISAEDGTEIWTSPLNGGSLDNSTAAISEGIVYVTHGNFWLSAQGFAIPALRSSTLYAFDVNDGSLLWQYKPGESTGHAGSPSVYDGRVYVVMSNGSYSGTIEYIVSCLDAITGQTEWEYKQSSFSVNSVPIITEDYVIYTSNDANVTALNIENGKRAWSKKISDTRPFIDLKFYAIASNGFVIAMGQNVDSQGKLQGYRFQIFEIESKGKVIFKEDFEDSNLLDGGLASYGKHILIQSLTHIRQIYADVPQLSVNPPRVALGDVERNSTQEFTLNVSNRGAKGLEGTVSTSDSWLILEKDKIDDATKSIKVTVKPKELDLLEHTGRIIFTGNGGSVTVPVTINVVDTTAPVVTINTDDLIKIDDLLYTNQTNYILKGQTETTAIVLIQGKDVELDADGVFESPVTLKEGKNEILIEATDEVGNEGQSTFVLYLDSKAPVVTVTTPNYKLSVDPNDYIMGTVDDLKAVVTVNGEELQLAPNGSFAKMVFLARGVNEFTIQAKDRVGNITELKHYLVFPEKKLIILFIGRKTAEINGVPVTLDVPPRIMSGRTMVPFRFIGEAMGAEVAWEAPEQKITLTLFGKQIVLRIGSTTAMVNGNPVVLDAPPTIIGGRTLVPIRFVSESLGAKVDWEGTQQRITITFPAS